METKFGGKSHNCRGPVVPAAVGKRTMEWDLNNWEWDGDLFSAAPAPQTNNGSSSCSVETNPQNQQDQREPDKRRKVRMHEEEDDGALNLKLGGQMYPKTEEKSGKKVCQVDACGADLSGAKDYHRRHKVCDMHSKAVKAVVGNVMQRFCQQCSRFHALEEFDEGKRSCRRRLDGHNRRRRKTHPENSVNEERGSSYLLVSLLKILSNLHSNNSDQRNDQDLLSHLLRNLASLADQGNLSGILAGRQDSHHAGTSFATPEKEEPSRPTQQTVNPSESETVDDGSLRNPAKPESLEATVGRMRLDKIDLNHVYDDSQDRMEASRSFENVPGWLRGQPQKSSPQRASGNSGSMASQSPSSSNGESRTDRIVFKLFGKDPNELPLALRNQILDWLSHSPTDIEGYIRPGCIILSIYLRMENPFWDELCYDLSRYLRKLLETSSNSFWRTGWVYTRVLDHVAFVCDGEIVLDTALPPKRHKDSTILTVKPIAVSTAETARFSVEGFNVSWLTSRLLCALEGSYLVETSCSDVMDGPDSCIDRHCVQSLSFSCSIPNISGRGFIEIEDDSLGSSFFPFIVAEEDVCSEIRTLESEIDVAEMSTEARARAVDFVNEIGWLLHRSRLSLRLPSLDPGSDRFSFERFRWLVEFSIDHEWRAVVKKLLTLVFSGAVDTLGHGGPVEAAVAEAGFLHRAVRRNSAPMVAFLLSYRPEKVSDALFRPDAAVPGGLTPLHVAAGKDGSERVLDALTDDPQLVGLEAWRRCRDSSGLTPYDYASMRGHYGYIHLLQRKLNKKRAEGGGHVAVDIPPEPPRKAAGLETEKAAVGGRCGECERKLGYCGGGGRSTLAVYKPTMVSMVGIAAVCVCVALLFKSSPQVMYIFQPFIWERLKYGAT